MIARERDYTTPQEVGLPEYEYPFAANGDTYTFLVTRDYKQTFSGFRADKVAGTYRPGATADTEHPTAWLIKETIPQPTATGLCIFRRTFAQVPTTQTVPGSMFINKPKLSGTFPQVMGDAYVIQPDPSRDSWTFYTRKTVTADTGAPGNLPTGGTYTLTFGVNTTGALAYNADASTIQTALNALASVTAYGSVTVAGSYSAGFTISWAAYALITADLASLVATYSTTRAVITSDAFRSQQRVTIDSTYTNGALSIASTLTPASVNPMPYPAGYNAQTISFGTYKYVFGSGYVPSDGGTYTITIFGQTTAAIAWDASAATVQSALNALSEVSNRGGYTITRTDNDTGYATGAGLKSYAGRLNTDSALTSGTFTLSVLGQTTAAIAYNASLSTISSAINALSNVTARGGVIVSGTGFASARQDFTITFANIPAFSTNGASLTPAEADSFVASTDSTGRSATLSFSVGASTVRTLIVPAHGVVSTDSIVVGSTLITGGLGSFSVPDANTIQLLAGSGLLYSVDTITTVGKVNGTYEAGTKLTRCNRVTDFYLPGITPGIATAADIPLPAWEGSDAALLEAIFAGDTEINYEVGELAQWRESPILARTITTINAALL